MNKIKTGLAAGSFPLCFAIIALDKKQVATFVAAIDMCISWLATLVTFGYYFVGDAFAKPVVKHKIFPVKLGGKTSFFYLVSIVDNATFQMIDIFETLVQHKGAGLFATYTTCTVHDDVLVF
jgi:hypothetical protein